MKVYKCKEEKCCDGEVQKEYTWEEMVNNKGVYVSKHNDRYLSFGKGMAIFLTGSELNMSDGPSWQNDKAFTKLPNAKVIFEVDDGE